MSMLTCVPGFAQCFARNATYSEHPHLWRGLIGAYATSFGPTGQTIYDQSGLSSHLTMKNMNNDDWTPLEYGYGVDFDGSNDFAVAEGNDSILDPGTGNLSVCFFIQSRETIGANRFRLAQKRGTGVAGVVAGWQISRNADAIGVSTAWNNTIFGSTSAYRAVFGKGSLDDALDGRRHHMCFTWDGATDEIKAYVDGKDAGITNGGSAAGTIGDVSNSRKFTLGAAWDDASTQSQYFNGIIQDCLIYNRVLPHQEIAELAAGASPFQRKPIRFSQSIVSGFLPRLTLLGAG